MTRDVIRQKLGTSRSIRRTKVQDLILSAGDRRIGERGTEESFDDVGEGVDAVHEDPETRECVGSCENTAKCEHHDEEQIEDTGCGVRIGKTGDDHVRKCRGEKEEHPDVQKDGDAAGVNLVRPFSVAVEADGIVPNNKGEDADELNTDVSKQ